VPYDHAILYADKTVLQGTQNRLVSIPVARFGHCEFTAGEVLTGFAIMLFQSGQQSPLALTESIADSSVRRQVRQLMTTPVFIEPAP
jgi:hypothetical protein